MSALRKIAFQARLLRKSQRGGITSVVSAPTGSDCQLGSRRAWVVWLVSALFVLFQFFLQLTSAQIVSGLMNSFSLSGLGAGFLASSYYYVYVLLQSPAGVMMDRYGPRRLLSIGALIVMVGCGVFAMAPVVCIAFAGRLMMGSGAAFAYVGSLHLLSKWFPVKRFGLMTALAETFGMVGTIVGGVFMASVMHANDWRTCMLFAAGVSLVIAVMIWVVVRDRPDNVHLITSRPSASWWGDTKWLFKNKVAWLNGIYAGCMFSIVTVFVALWGVPFIQLAYQLNLADATMVCDAVFVGVALGGPLVGWLDARYPTVRRLLLVALPAVAMMIVLAILYVPHQSMLDLSVNMFFLGLFVSNYVLNFIIGNQIAEPHTRGASVGFVNMLSVGMAPLLQPLIGWLLDFVSPAHAVAPTGQLNYTLHEYHIALSLIPLCLLGAVVIGFFLPTPKKTEADSGDLADPIV